MPSLTLHQSQSQLDFEDRTHMHIDSVNASKLRGNLPTVTVLSICKRLTIESKSLQRKFSVSSLLECT